MKLVTLMWACCFIKMDNGIKDKFGHTVSDELWFCLVLFVAVENIILLLGNAFFLLMYFLWKRESCIKCIMGCIKNRMFLPKYSL